MESSICCGFPCSTVRLMSSVASRRFDPQTYELSNKRPFYSAISSATSFGTRVFLLLVTVTTLQPAAAVAAGSRDGVANRSGSSGKASKRKARQRHEQRPCDPDG